MFDIFNKKPDAILQNELGRRGYEISEVFMGIASSLEIPLREGLSYPVENLENKKKLSDAIVQVINDYGLSDIVPVERTKLILSITKGGHEDLMSKEKDAAFFLITMINMFEVIARQYYEYFPEYEPLRVLVDRTAKVVCPGFACSIGDNVPIEIRRAWPYFSSIFEQMRARGGFLNPEYWTNQT